MERRFITKVLKLVDFYSVNHVRSVRSRSLHANTVRGMTSNQRGLKLWRDLSKDNAYILRESETWIDGSRLRHVGPAVVPQFETCGKRVKKQGFIHR